MQRAITFTLFGTLISYLFTHYVAGGNLWEVDLYNGFSFGLGWGMAYWVDRPEWPLSKKLGISLLGIGVLVALGLLVFNFETAIPSIIKFSTVFVAYYLIASLRSSKSLRS